MTFTVVYPFHDLTDFKQVKSSRLYYHYEIGDPYPRAGKKASPERIMELASDKNNLHRPLIISDEFMTPPADLSAADFADAPTVEEKQKPKRKRKTKKQDESELMPGA